MGCRVKVKRFVVLTFEVNFIMYSENALGIENFKIA